MMNEKMTPHKWAIKLTHILNAVLPASERFPVDVISFAKDYSKQIYPDDPITMIKGQPLSNFDGGLYKAPPHKKGWGIIYNNAIKSEGRINFTLAHEFGHYLLHRVKYPQGLFECGSQDLIRWDSEYGQIEYEANTFASNFLMPLDDYRQQIDPAIKVDFEMLGLCVERYKVSLIAATLRWIEFTERKAAIVVSRDGFILWGRASKSAYHSGIYFKTRNQLPIAVPDNSLAAAVDLGMIDICMDAKKLPAGVWHHEPCEERIVISDNYDLVISLLQYD